MSLQVLCPMWCTINLYVLSYCLRCKYINNHWWSACALTRMTMLGSEEMYLDSATTFVALLMIASFASVGPILFYFWLLLKGEKYKASHSKMHNINELPNVGIQVSRSRRHEISGVQPQNMAKKKKEMFFRLFQKTLWRNSKRQHYRRSRRKSASSRILICVHLKLMDCRKPIIMKPTIDNDIVGKLKLDWIYKTITVSLVRRRWTYILRHRKC